MNLQEENLFNNLMYLQDQIQGINVFDNDNRVESIIASKQAQSTWEQPTIIDGVPVKVALNFSKSQETDYQFFNNYSMEFKKGENAVKQTFYINKKQNISLDEGFKLMNGRAVRKTLTSKEGQRYNVWYQLDFKNISKNGNARLNKYHDAYGFDHAELLKNSGIKDVENQLYTLMNKLEAGERVQAVKEVNGKEVNRFLEVNLPYKALNVYDENGKLILKECVSMSQIQAKTKQQSVGQTAAQQPEHSNTVASERVPNQQQAEARQESEKTGVEKREGINQNSNAKGTADALKENAKAEKQTTRRGNRKGRSVA